MQEQSMRSQSTHSQSMRSDIYLLLATLLRDVPSAELFTFLAELDFEANGTEMAKAWQAISAAAHNVQADSLADEYLAEEYQALFIGIGRGEVVPFASWHLTGSLMEKPLAEIRDDLSRLGLERDEQVREPEDHISALCETMAYLCEQGDDENADALTQQAFFNRHIAPWFGKLVSQIRQAPHAQFYLAVAQLLDAFLSLEQVAMTQAPSSRKNRYRIEVKNLTDKAEQ